MSLISKSSLLRVFVGDEWQNFIGLSYSETQSRIRAVLEELGWEFTATEETSSAGDRLVLGGDDTTSFEIEDLGITVDCVSASYDPIQRAVFGLFVREQTKEKYRNAVTVIRISPIDSDTEPAVARFVNTLIDSLDEDPWAIVHPRFNLSPILRYKTRVFWTYWVSNDSQSSYRKHQEPI